ncbi:MAG: hypothetical protein JNK64_08500 [Myxococcales bacterium]|nr:hypothetical protein [Myxococcales bacterium]
MTRKGLTLKELTALFRKLGAPSPGAWAQSQHTEDIDQLARFAFLREAWKGVVAPDDVSWIDQTAASTKPGADEPCGGVGPALQRLLAAGADPEDIHEVVRVMQYELLFSICYLLEDPGQLEPEIADLAWRLMRTNEDGEVVGPIEGLHESVLELDPSGREMRRRRTAGTPRD